MQKVVVINDALTNGGEALGISTKLPKFGKREDLKLHGTRPNITRGDRVEKFQIQFDIIQELTP